MYAKDLSLVEGGSSLKRWWLGGLQPPACNRCNESLFYMLSHRNLGADQAKDL